MVKLNINVTQQSGSKTYEIAQLPLGRHPEVSQ